MKRYRALNAAIVPGVIAVALLGAGCGGNSKKDSGDFSASAKADSFAGPTPLTSRFTASAKHANGAVHYRWRFDDGTSSEEQNPVHTFNRAGYYTVIMDARDEGGDNTRQSLLLGVWPPKQWANAQRTQLTKAGALRAQKVQQKRTDQRHKELRTKERSAALQGS